ncbi:MAG: hypothetical protein F4089_06050 [Gammaproteobacteria bacterium]|nr:hypothetical protein [Gammaproteobacteria bacterium]
MDEAAGHGHRVGALVDTPWLTMTIALVPDCMTLYTPDSGNCCVTAVAAALGSGALFIAWFGSGFTIQ